MDEALKLADHLVILKDGKIVQQGDPQRVLIEPEDRYVFDFVSDTNRARVLRVRTIMEPISSSSHMFIEGEIDQEEETLETMIKLSGGDISKNYLVKNGVDSVGIAKMERLLEALVPVKKNEICSKEI